jgi:hypothetical protein
MMSTALVMTVGSEQTKMHSAAASDRVEGGEMTFAQSFGERAGLSMDVQTMNSAGEASNETREGKSSVLLKNFDVSPIAAAGTKPNSSLDQRVIEGNEANGAVKSVVTGVDDITLAKASERAQSKANSVPLPADGGQLKQNIGAKAIDQTGASQKKPTATTAKTGSGEQAVDDVEGIETPAPSAAPAAESATVDAVPRESTVAADQSLPSHDAAAQPVPSETAPAVKIDVTAAKKGAKAQESAVGTKATSKPAITTESAKAIGDVSFGGGIGTQGAIALPIQAVATSDGRPSAGVTAASISGVLGATAGQLVAGASASGTDGTDRKAIQAAEKGEVEVTRQGAIATVDTTAATGFGVEIAKAMTVASTAGKDGDAKGLSAVHAVGSEGTVSGIVAGMTSGHTPAEVSVMKVQAAGAGAHAGSSQAGLMDQDGSGAVSGEMGMSHRTLLATPMALEVGLAGGTQGWLKIRAEMTDGGIVNASLSSATSAGQEMLHRELPALTAYLKEERVAVNTVVVPASSAAGTDSRFAGGMNGEGSGQTQQGSGQGGDDRQGLIHGSADRADEVPTFAGLNGVGDDGLLSAGTYAGGGSWLNVRA